MVLAKKNNYIQINKLEETQNEEKTDRQTHPTQKKMKNVGRPEQTHKTTPEKKETKPPKK